MLITQNQELLYFVNVTVNEILNTCIIVFGALLGKQNGRQLELFNSFELQHSETSDGVIIEMEYFRNKEEQCKTYHTTTHFLLT